DSQHSPLGRLLLAREPNGYVPADGGTIPPDAKVLARLQEIQTAAPGCISVTRSHVGDPVTWRPPTAGSSELEAARFDRELDLRWRRTSYSDITSAAHDPLVGSEPEEPSLHDEPEAPTPVPAFDATRAELALPSPLGGMPVGVTFGTLVHRVFEAVDFTAADLDAELTE